MAEVTSNSNSKISMRKIPPSAASGSSNEISFEKKTRAQMKAEQPIEFDSSKIESALLDPKIIERRVAGSYCTSEHDGPTVSLGPGNGHSIERLSIIVGLPTAPDCQQRKSHVVQHRNSLGFQE
ncbi:hypothetical protein DOTSEDRAFT_22762 [Dothistroma septosporum NZE10]|uniref:Uncharacterized protein n=1 Tax=Dothistroma septosporum (strain NZE10 / CBS 128990) TaxID=675120 RepID=N1PTM1_DOTSN|nr:hypothetical protein DOTSEDRAFT_22762 [Dothistroma septosporum NZE10]